jgi:cytochrome P450
MNKRALLLLPFRVLRRGKRMARGLARRVLPQKKQVVFVFGGRTQYWPGMGRDLYEKEPVFRKTVQQCDVLIREISGIDILPNFEGPLDPAFFEEESHIILCIAVIQLAQCELWTSKGIYPHAVMGISLGEATANYATGALSLADALRILCGYAIYCQPQTCNVRVIYAQLGLEQAFELVASAPVWMEPIYEAGPQGTLLFCDQDNLKRAADFFAERGITSHVPHEDKSRAYHTSRMHVLRKLVNDFNAAITPRPSYCPYYSTSLGSVLPSGALIDKRFWQDLTESPVLTHTTICAALQDGHAVFVHLGPHPFLKGQLQQAAGGAKMLLLDSMHRQQPEPAQFEATRKILARLWRHPSPLHPKNKPAPGAWQQQFRFSQPHVARNPYPYFRELQASGPVHFLPAENAWLVLDYATIDEVLKRPEIFSSTLHQSFDALLLGSDPPAHTTMRTLLQPLFSPQVLSELGSFAEAEAHRLLESLSRQPSFDLVSGFSLPLAKSVIARFLGLTMQEAGELERCLEGPVYGLGYLPQLEIFCRQYLSNAKNTMGATGLLLRLVEEGTLSMEEAVRLMRMLWIAGMTTTSMLLSQSVYQLLMHPHLAQNMRDDAGLIHKFVEECLRMEAPESELRRITMQPVELGGQPLPAGAIVMLGLRAANRDPNYFEQPDNIMLDRPVKRHLSFGGGYHYCLGVGMARTEARHALKAVLEVLPSLRLDLGASAGYFPSPHFRGLAQLRVRHDVNNEPIITAHEQ